MFTGVSCVLDSHHIPPLLLSQLRQAVCLLLLFICLHKPELWLQLFSATLTSLVLMFLKFYYIMLLLTVIKILCSWVDEYYYLCLREEICPVFPVQHLTLLLSSVLFTKTQVHPVPRTAEHRCINHQIRRYLSVTA